MSNVYNISWIFHVLLYYFLVYAIFCMYVYVIALFLAMCSWVDVDPSEEYQEPSSAGHFEQQEQFEEGKYNMNTTYHF